MNDQVHQLKVWPSYFAGLWSGAKTFEVRLDDRGYQTGDQLELREYDTTRWCDCRDTAVFHHDDCPKYTGRIVTARVGWITASTPRRGQQAGFNGNGYVVMALCDMAGSEADTTDYAAPIEAAQAGAAIAAAARIAAAPRDVS